MVLNMFIIYQSDTFWNIVPPDFVLKSRKSVQWPIFSETLNPKPLILFSSFYYLEKHFEVVQIADLQARLAI